MSWAIATIVAFLFAAPATSRSPPRAARSVHLSYIAPKADVFYNEMTITRSTRGSYFMACGFSGGYFGLQELGDGKKVAIFSVWDIGGKQQDDPNAVKAEQRVDVLFQNPAARVKRFGGEGTGAQCLIDFDWKLNETYCFAVRADQVPERTSYAAYCRPSNSGEWVHLATFQTLNGGKRMTGFYSFIEDFRRDFKSANDVRAATFTNGWLHVDPTKWEPITQARFTASGAEWEAKDTIDAGVNGETFFLQTGGDTKQHVKLKDTIERAATKSSKPPEVPAEE